MADDALGSALCTQCGLCCAGALHDRAVLDEDEIEPARFLGLPVVDDGRPAFALPCPRLENSMCTIYESRPRVCGRYKCKLLQDLEAAEVTLEQASERVATAKDLLRAARAVAPEGLSLMEARHLVQSQPSAKSLSESGSAQQSHMQLRLRTTALNLYLDSHFRNAQDPKTFVLAAVGDAVKGE